MICTLQVRKLNSNCAASNALFRNRHGVYLPSYDKGKVKSGDRQTVFSIMFGSVFFLRGLGLGLITTYIMQNLTCPYGRAAAGKEEVELAERFNRTMSFKPELFLVSWHQLTAFPQPSAEEKAQKHSFMTSILYASVVMCSDSGNLRRTYCSHHRLQQTTVAAGHAAKLETPNSQLPEGLER